MAAETFLPGTGSGVWTVPGLVSGSVDFSDTAGLSRKPLCRWHHL